MKKYLGSFILASVIFTLTLVVGILFRDTKEVEAGGDGFVAYNCTASSSAITIGDDISTQILATTSRRAWARVSLANNATNTASLAWNDVTAVHNTGTLLNAAVTGGASTTPSLDFGLNTDFPYTGAVKVITNFSTTTILVTQCVYNR